MNDKPQGEQLPSIGAMVEASQFRDALEGMGQILEMAKHDVPTVSETFFKAHILDVLADTSGNADLEKWMGVAGHPGRPINVTDDAGTKILFQVPPLLQWREARYSRLGSTSYRAIIERAAHMRELSPQRAKQDLIVELDQATPPIPPDLGQAVQIDTILRRYGRDPIFEDAISEDGEDDAPRVKAVSKAASTMPVADTFEEF